MDKGLKPELSKLLLNSSPDPSPQNSEKEVNEIDLSPSYCEIEGKSICSNQCSKNQDYWKAIVEMNGLSLNVLTDT